MLDVPPLLEVASHDFFRLCTRTGLFDTSNVKRAVLSRKRADTTHVVAIVRKFVARKAVLARIGQRLFWVR